MHPELKQFLRLSGVILGLIALASLGLIIEPLNGLAWLAAPFVLVGGFLLGRAYLGWGKPKRQD